MSIEKRICSIFKSPRKHEMYLYVDKKEGLERVPKELLSIFGTPLLVFDLLLTAQRKLAREDIVQVLANIEHQGYHLQMPPPPNEEEIMSLPDELLRFNEPI